MKKNSEPKPRSILLPPEEEKPEANSIARPFLITLSIVLIAALVFLFRTDTVRDLLSGDATSLLQSISEARAAVQDSRSDTPAVSPAPTVQPESTPSPAPTPTPVPPTPTPTVDPGPLLTLEAEDNAHSIDRYSFLQLSVKDAAEDDVFTWSTTNAEIATVDRNGQVYGTSGGSCWISATDEDGVTGAYLITVNVPVSSLWYDAQKYEVSIDHSCTPLLTTSPLDATDTSYVLTSDDPSIARISTDGKSILGVSEGTTIVRATAASGAKCEAWVDVVPVPVESVTITNAPETLAVGQSFQLQFEVSPDDAADQSVTWSTGNNYVLDVSSTGMLTANHAGKCGIAAKSANGVRGYIEITVTE